MDRELKEQERVLNPPSAAFADQFDGSSPEPFSCAGNRRPIRSSRRPAEQGKTFDASKEQNPGVVIGIAQSCYRKADGEEHFRVLPGEDVQLSFYSALRRRKS